LQEAARSILSSSPPTPASAWRCWRNWSGGGRGAAQDFDIQVQDIHHRDKLDSPSVRPGAGAAAAEGRKTRVDPVMLHCGVGMSSASMKWIPGPGEQLRLGHAVTDRAVFARVPAGGCWLTAQKPGFTGWPTPGKINSCAAARRFH